MPGRAGAQVRRFFMTDKPGVGYRCPARTPPRAGAVRHSPRAGRNDGRHYTTPNDRHKHVARNVRTSPGNGGRTSCKSAGMRAD
ncbi:hypothetical protein BGC_51140 [Burkholderia sp. 3C]